MFSVLNMLVGSGLALVQIHTGDFEAAEANARRAYRLQPASPVAAQAWLTSRTHIR